MRAVREIVEAEGPESLTIRAIADAAGVSPTSVYKHVGDKQDVIIALMSETFDSLREALLNVTEKDPVARLRKAGLVYREFALKSPGAYRLMWHQPRGEAAGKALAALTEIVRYGQVSREFREGDPADFAIAIWASVHGFIELELRPEKSEAARHEYNDETYEVLLGLLVRGIHT